MGASVENQAMAEKRVSELINIPAHIRFLSVEPLLERIDISPYLGYNTQIGEYYNEQSIVRENFASVSRERGVDDRSAGYDLEERKESRTQIVSRIPSSQENDKWNSNKHGSAQISLFSFQGRDSAGNSDQSQEWGEGRQQTGKLGTGNLLREHEARLYDGIEESGRREESSGEINELAGGADQGRIRTGRGNSGEVRDEIRGFVQDNIENSTRGTSSETKWADGGLYEETEAQERVSGFGGKISFVIVGGESGPGCRLFDWDWARDLRDQCKKSNVAFWMKQGGGYPNSRHKLEDIPEDLRIREFPKFSNTFENLLKQQSVRS